MRSQHSADIGKPQANYRVRGDSHSCDGNRVFANGVDRAVRTWETETGNPLASLVGHTGTVNSVATLPSGRLAVSGSDDGTVRTWDVDAEEEIAAFAEHTDAVVSVAISPSGNHIVSGSRDGTIRRWEWTAAR